MKPYADRVMEEHDLFPLSRALSIWAANVAALAEENAAALTEAERLLRELLSWSPLLTSPGYRRIAARAFAFLEDRK